METSPMALIRRISLIVIGGIFLNAILINPSSPSAAASVLPKVTLVSPTAGSSVHADTPLNVTLDFTGGLAASANNCDIGGADGSPVFEAARFDASGQGEVYQSGSFSFHSGLWKAKIIPGGIECTLTLSDPSLPVQYGGFQPINSEESDVGKLFGLQYQNPYPVIKNFASLKIYYGYLKYAELSDLASLLQTATFNALPSSSPTFKFIGIARGDTVDIAKRFKVDMTIGKSFSLNGGADGAFRLEGAWCKSGSQLPSSSEVITIEKECVVIPAVDSNSAQSTISITASVATAQGQNFTSDPIVVNIGDNRFPAINVSETDYRPGPSSIAGGKTFILLEVRGSAQILIPSGSSEPDRQAFTQNLSFCIKEKCSPINVDSKSGYFDIQQQLEGTSVNWTIRGQIHGWDIDASSFSQGYNSNFPHDLSATGWISGNGSVAPLPKPIIYPPVKLRISNVAFPQKVKWGNGFNVKISASGSGQARCELDFQATVSQGRYGFSIAANTEVTVPVRPWYRGFQLWPLTVRCVPSNWPDKNPLIPPIFSQSGSIYLVP